MCERSTKQLQQKPAGCTKVSGNCITYDPQQRKVASHAYLATCCRQSKLVSSSETIAMRVGQVCEQVRERRDEARSRMRLYSLTCCRQSDKGECVLDICTCAGGREGGGEPG